MSSVWLLNPQFNPVKSTICHFLTSIYMQEMVCLYEK